MRPGKLRIKTLKIIIMSGSCPMLADLEVIKCVLVKYLSLVGYIKKVGRHIDTKVIFVIYQ